MSKSGFSLNDKKSKLSLIVEQRFRKHEFQADYDRRSIEKLNGIIESQRSEINHAHAGNEQLRRDPQLLCTVIEAKLGITWSSYEKSQLYGRVEAISRVYIPWIFEKKINSKIETLFLNSQPRFRNYRTKLVVWMIREILKMLNQYAVDSHVTSQPALFPPFRDPGGMLSRSLGMPSRNGRPPRIWDTHGISGNVFANPAASSSEPHPQESNPWISKVSEHTSPHVMRESQTPALDPRCQSGLSARNSFNPSEERFSKNYRADQQRLQISDLHFDKFLNPATFACWKISFKFEECICSQFSTEATLWIKEVDMVESVDDLKSSCSIRGIRKPDFEVLDAKIASALNWIIHHTLFKKKVSLEEQVAQKEDRRSHTWCRTTFESLELMIPFLTMLVYSKSLFATTMFKTSIRDGMKFCCLWPRSRRMMFWKVCANREYSSVINSKLYSICTTWKFIRRV